jgi:hypothetical protein
MTHHWHLEDSHVGCLPDSIIIFDTKKEAVDFLRGEIASEQAFLAECDLPPLRGTLRSGYFEGGTRRIFIERCDDPRCEWEED